jgi:hypothetical protein
METLNVTIHNVTTGEIEVVPMTEDEVALHLADREETAQMKAEAEAKKAARLALLDKLGITEAEATLLLS